MLLGLAGLNSREPHDLEEIEVLGLRLGTNPYRWRRQASLWLLCVALIGIWWEAAAAAPPRSFGVHASAAFTIYLPLVSTPDPFSGNQAIWIHAEAPKPHEVALFRHTLTLAQRLGGAELTIFADTRYEVWLDGQWVGRGPARFSQKTHEYDVYQLGDLEPGEYLLAVLVQWAPNNRRSESVTPKLMAHVQGMSGHSFRVFAGTNPLWKAMRADAWKTDASPVHAWQLIGPTELLDLRHLPADWMRPGFDDENWPQAVVRSSGMHAYDSELASTLFFYENMRPGSPRRIASQSSAPSSVKYQPRSIPHLEDVLLPIEIVDTGFLSPGRSMSEITPPVAEPTTFLFNAFQPTLFTVEGLSLEGTALTDTVRLNEHQIAWRQAGVERPDVWLASTVLNSGEHTLSFRTIPAGGTTFSVSSHSVQKESFPFEQGIHAGRRLLLAEPSSQSAVQATGSATGDLSLELTGPAAYAVLDIGRIAHGRLEADVMGPPGTVLDIGWAQRLWREMRPLPYPGMLHKEWNQVDSWVLDGTKRSITTIDARAGRYILIAAWADGPVRLENVRVYEERYPVEEKGRFQSDDPLLNSIWQVGVDTLYPNMTDAYNDTPWRERGQWWGDAFVEANINQVAFGDSLLLRRGLVYMAEAFEEGEPNAVAPNAPGFVMLDFGMLWVQGLGMHWRMAGDVELLRDVYPVLREFLTYLQGYEHGETNLLDIPIGHWSQTGLIDWAAGHSRYGQSTAMNSIYYGALLDAAVIADAVGDPAQAAIWRAKAGLIKQQVNKHLYLPAEQRYVTTIYEGDNLPPSPHAQAWPLAYEVTSPSEVDGVTASLLTMLSKEPSAPNVEIYGMFWLLKALGEIGRIPEALQVIRSFYGYMLDQGATTWWEGFTAEAHYTASLAHGWGGSPTWFLNTYLLGAQQLSSDTWLAKPALTGVRYASGVLPLKNGDLAISWERPSCAQARLDVTAPVSTSGEIVFPFVQATTVLTMDGQVIWEQGAPLVGGVYGLEDGVHVTLQAGGSHLLHGTQSCERSFLPIINR